MGKVLEIGGLYSIDNGKTKVVCTGRMSENSYKVMRVGDGWTMTVHNVVLSPERAGEIAWGFSTSGRFVKTAIYRCLWVGYSQPIVGVIYCQTYPKFSSLFICLRTYLNGSCDVLRIGDGWAMHCLDAHISNKTGELEYSGSTRGHNISN